MFDEKLLYNAWRDTGIKFDEKLLTTHVVNGCSVSKRTRVKSILTEILQAQCVKETAELCMVLDDRGKFFLVKKFTCLPPPIRSVVFL